MSLVVQDFFFFAHDIAVLPWLPCYPDQSTIDNFWSMIAERLIPDTPPSAIPD